MTVHAMEEMAEDDLDIVDIEQALLTGQVVRNEKDDLRGTKYVVEGFAADTETRLASLDVFKAASVM